MIYGDELVKEYVSSLSEGVIVSRLVVDDGRWIKEIEF